MDRMIVTVFDSEAKAYEGLRALEQLNNEGSIAVYSSAVLAKDSNGKIAVRQAADQGPWGSAAGLAIGALVGALGGPAGMAIGAAAGAYGGSLGDLTTLDVDLTFLDDVGKTLSAGKSALVAAVNEEWVTPLDTRMEALGGIVLRRTRNEVNEEQYKRQADAVDAEIKQYQAELARANVERREKLQARIDDLSKKLDGQVQAIKNRQKAVQREGEARLKVLQDRAAAASAEMKSSYNAEIKRLREEYNRRVDQLKV